MVPGGLVLAIGRRMTSSTDTQPVSGHRGREARWQGGLFPVSLLGIATLSWAWSRGLVLVILEVTEFFSDGGGRDFFFRLL